jgi:hypothetical protein
MTGVVRQVLQLLGNILGPVAIHGEEGDAPVVGYAGLQQGSDIRASRHIEGVIENRVSQKDEVRHGLRLLSQHERPTTAHQLHYARR